jgi:hypothetical protein
MPCLQDRAYDSDRNFSARAPDSTAASAFAMTTPSRDVELTAFVEARANLRPQAPIRTENITSHPPELNWQTLLNQNSQLFVSFRRFPSPGIQSQKFIQSP